MALKEKSCREWVIAELRSKFFKSSVQVCVLKSRLFRNRHDTDVNILVLNYDLFLPHELTFESFTPELYFYLVNRLRIICSGLLAFKNKVDFMTRHNNHIQKELLQN